MPQTTSDKQRFGRACSAAIAAQDRSMKDIAKMVPNCPASQFTRWKNGMWTYVPEDKLIALVKAIHPNDYRGQLELICEYLADLTPQEYRPSLLLGQKQEAESTAQATVLRRPMTGPGSRWNEDMRHRLDNVALAYELDNDFAAMVDNIVNWAKRIVKQHDEKKR